MRNALHLSTYTSTCSKYVSNLNQNTNHKRSSFLQTCLRFEITLGNFGVFSWPFSLKNVTSDSHLSPVVPWRRPKKCLSTSLNFLKVLGHDGSHWASYFEVVLLCFFYFFIFFFSQKNLSSKVVTSCWNILDYKCTLYCSFLRHSLIKRKFWNQEIKCCITFLHIATEMWLNIL